MKKILQHEKTAKAANNQTPQQKEKAKLKDKTRTRPVVIKQTTENKDTEKNDCKS